jgi:hypothetical protein
VLFTFAGVGIVVIVMLLVGLLTKRTAKRRNRQLLRDGRAE